jgi:hypothetical protein
MLQRVKNILRTFFEKMILVSRTILRDFTLFGVILLRI